MVRATRNTLFFNWISIGKRGVAATLVDALWGLVIFEPTSITLENTFSQWWYLLSVVSEGGVALLDAKVGEGICETTDRASGLAISISLVVGLSIRLGEIGTNIYTEIRGCICILSSGLWTSLHASASRIITKEAIGTHLHTSFIAIVCVVSWRGAAIRYAG